MTAGRDPPLRGDGWPERAAYDERVVDASGDPFFRTVIESAALPIVTFDETGAVVCANPAVAGTFGRDPASLVGEPAAVLVPEGRRDRFRERFERVAAAGGDGAAIAVQTVARHTDGHRVPVELSVRPHEHEGQRLVTATFNEIDRPDERDDRADGTETDVRESDDGSVPVDAAQFRRERDLTEQLFRTVPIGLLVLSAEGVIERINERGREILGVDPDEVIGESRRTDAWRLLDTDGRPKPPSERTFHRALDTGEPVTDVEEIVERRDGERVWVLVNAAPLYDGDGIERVVIAVEDISEQKAREEALKEEQRFTRSVHDAIPDLLYTVDTDGRFLRWNDRVREVTGYADEDIADMAAFDLVRERDREAALEALREVVREDETGSFEADVVTKAGERIPYEFSGAPLRDADGDVIGLTGMARDVTERKRRERRLEEQNERLERLDRINGVIREIDRALVRATTHREIDEAVCEAFAAADPYVSAWIGDVNAASESVTPRASAGDITATLDEITVSTDPDAGRGPAGEAVRTRSVQVSHDVQADPAFEPVRGAVAAHGIRSVASVPIVYEDSLYGVLTIYSDRSDVFDDTERAVLAELGATTGHAINAVTTRQALVAENVTELTFRLTDEADFLVALSAAADCEATFEGSALRDDESMLHYVTVSASEPDRVVEFAEAFDGVEDVRLVSVRPDGTCLLEATFDGPDPFAVAADLGAVVQSAHAADGESTVVVEAPLAADVRAIVEAMTSNFDGVELLAQRERTRTDATVPGVRAALDEELTDRQAGALEAAYRAGFFEWPRESTGEEVADAMGVSAPTFHKHLRLAEAKLLAELFDMEVRGGGSRDRH